MKDGLFVGYSAVEVHTELREVSLWNFETGENPMVRVTQNESWYRMKENKGKEVVHGVRSVLTTP